MTEGLPANLGDGKAPTGNGPARAQMMCLQFQEPQHGSNGRLGGSELGRNP